MEGNKRLRKDQSFSKNEEMKNRLYKEIDQLYNCKPITERKKIRKREQRLNELLNFREQYAIKIRKNVWTDNCEYEKNELIYEFIINRKTGADIACFCRDNFFFLKSVIKWKEENIKSILFEKKN